MNLFLRKTITTVTSLSNSSVIFLHHHRCFCLFSAIHAYLNSDEYNNNFEKASAIFNADEKKRIEQAKKVAAEESKRTGKPIAPVYKDTNEHDIANLPGSQLYFTIQTFLEKYINKIASVSDLN